MSSALFRDSTVLITGASGGLGAAMAGQLAASGARLALTGRDEVRLGRAAAAARSGGAAVETIAADLASPGGVTALLERLDARGLVVDHLVNNAGVGVQGRGDTAPLADQLRVIDVNVRAATELALRLLPGMVARGRGGILNIASAAAFQGLPGLSVYSASKAYILTWSEALHHELRGTGVRCTCLCPGPVDTAFFETAGMGRPPRLYAMQSPVSVARAGLRAYRRNASHAMPGPVARAGAWLTRFAPRALSTRVAAGYTRPGTRR